MWPPAWLKNSMVSGTDVMICTWGHPANRLAPLCHLEIGIASHHARIVLLGPEHGQRRMMHREPLAVVPQHRLGRSQQPHPAVARRRLHRDEPGILQASDQMIDLARARHPERDHTLLEGSDRAPGLAPGRIMFRVEMHRHEVHEEPPLLEQQPAQERIIAIEIEELPEVEASRRRHQRMGHDRRDRLPGLAHGEPCGVSGLHDSVHGIRPLAAFQYMDGRSFAGRKSLQAYVGSRFACGARAIRRHLEGPTPMVTPPSDACLAVCRPSGVSSRVSGSHAPRSACGRSPGSM